MHELRHQLSSLDLRAQLTIIALLAAMALSGVIAVRQRASAVVLALLSLVWLSFDSPFEGRILYTVSAHHGLTETDLVGVLGLLAAAVLLIYPRRA